jgi:hypothetical protein
MSGGFTASPGGPPTLTTATAWRWLCVTKRGNAKPWWSFPWASGRGSARRTAQIAPELVARAIASAVAAGWEPLSRGRTVAIVVDETGA